MSLVSYTLLSVVLLAGQNSPSSGQDKVTLEHCVVSLIDEAQVPAKRAGVLRTLDVAEGALVQEGALVAQIDDAEAVVRRKIAQREYEAAKKESENDIDVRYSTAAAAVARAEYEKAMEVNRKVPGTISESEVKRLRLAYRRATLGIEQAQYQHDIAVISTTVREAHIEGADLEINERRITSPLDGIVVRLHRHPGEWVEAGAPICHIVRLDRLRVTGFVNVNEYDHQQIIGRPVKVTVTLANGRTAEFESTIDYASPLIQPGGEYRVWAAVENKTANRFWVLRPGLPAEMEISLTKPLKTAAKP